MYRSHGHCFLGLTNELCGANVSVIQNRIKHLLRVTTNETRHPKCAVLSTYSGALCMSGTRERRPAASGRSQIDHADQYSIGRLLDARWKAGMTQRALFWDLV